MSSEDTSISVPKTASAVKPPSTVKTASSKTKTPKTASAKPKVSHFDKVRPLRATASEQDIPRKGGPKHDCELDDVYAACTMTTEREFVIVLANILVLETHSIGSLFFKVSPQEMNWLLQVLPCWSTCSSKTVSLSRFLLKRGYWHLGFGVMATGKETSWMLKNSTIKNFEMPLNGLMMRTVMTKSMKGSQPRNEQRILVLLSRELLSCLTSSTVRWTSLLSGEFNLKLSVELICICTC